MESNPIRPSDTQHRWSSSHRSRPINTASMPHLAATPDTYDDDFLTEDMKSEYGMTVAPSGSPVPASAYHMRVAHSSLTNALPTTTNVDLTPARQSRHRPTTAMRSRSAAHAHTLSPSLVSSVTDVSVPPPPKHVPISVTHVPISTGHATISAGHAPPLDRHAPGSVGTHTAPYHGSRVDNETMNGSGHSNSGASTKARGANGGSDNPANGGTGGGRGSGASDSYTASFESSNTTHTATQDLVKSFRTVSGADGGTNSHTSNYTGGPTDAYTDPHASSSTGTYSAAFTDATEDIAHTHTHTDSSVPGDADTLVEAALHPHPHAQAHTHVYIRESVDRGEEAVVMTDRAIGGAGGGEKQEGAEEGGVGSVDAGSYGNNSSGTEGYAGYSGDSGGAAYSGDHYSAAYSGASDGDGGYSAAYSADFERTDTHSTSTAGVAATSACGARAGVGEVYMGSRGEHDASAEGAQGEEEEVNRRRERQSEEKNVAIGATEEYSSEYADDFTATDTVENVVQTPDAAAITVGESTEPQRETNADNVDNGDDNYNNFVDTSYHPDGDNNYVGTYADDYSDNYDDAYDDNGHEYVNSFDHGGNAAHIDNYDNGNNYKDGDNVDNVEAMNTGHIDAYDDYQDEYDDNYDVNDDNTYNRDDNVDNYRDAFMASLFPEAGVRNDNNYPLDNNINNDDDNLDNIVRDDNYYNDDDDDEWEATVTRVSQGPVESRAARAAEGRARAERELVVVMQREREREERQETLHEQRMADTHDDNRNDHDDKYDNDDNNTDNDDNEDDELSAWHEHVYTSSQDVLMGVDMGMAWGEENEEDDGIEGNGDCEDEEDMGAGQDQEGESPARGHGGEEMAVSGLLPVSVPLPASVCVPVSVSELSPVMMTARVKSAPEEITSTSPATLHSDATTLHDDAVEMRGEVRGVESDQKVRMDVTDTDADVNAAGTVAETGNIALATQPIVHNNAAATVAAHRLNNTSNVANVPIGTTNSNHSTIASPQTSFTPTSPTLHPPSPSLGPALPAALGPLLSRAALTPLALALLPQLRTHIQSRTDMHTQPPAHANTHPRATATSATVPSSNSTSATDSPSPSASVKATSPAASMTSPTAPTTTTVATATSGSNAATAGQSGTSGAPPRMPLPQQRAQTLHSATQHVHAHTPRTVLSTPTGAPVTESVCRTASSKASSVPAAINTSLGTTTASVAAMDSSPVAVPELGSSTAISPASAASAASALAVAATGSSAASLVPLRMALEAHRRRAALCRQNMHTHTHTHAQVPAQTHMDTYGQLDVSGDNGGGKGGSSTSSTTATTNTSSSVRSTVHTSAALDVNTSTSTSTSTSGSTSASACSPIPLMLHPCAALPSVRAWQAARHHAASMPTDLPELQDAFPQANTSAASSVAASMVDLRADSRGGVSGIGNLGGGGFLGGTSSIIPGSRVRPPSALPLPSGFARAQAHSHTHGSIQTPPQTRIQTPSQEQGQRQMQTVGSTSIDTGIGTSAGAVCGQHPTTHDQPREKAGREAANMGGARGRGEGEAQTRVEHSDPPCESTSAHTHAHAQGYARPRPATALPLSRPRPPVTLTFADETPRTSTRAPMSEPLTCTHTSAIDPSADTPGNGPSVCMSVSAADTGMRPQTAVETRVRVGEGVDMRPRAVACGPRAYALMTNATHATHAHPHAHARSQSRGREGETGSTEGEEGYEAETAAVSKRGMQKNTKDLERGAEMEMRQGVNAREWSGHSGVRRSPLLATHTDTTIAATTATGKNASVNVGSVGLVKAGWAGYVLKRPNATTAVNTGSNITTADTISSFPRPSRFGDGDTAWLYSWPADEGGAAERRKRADAHERMQRGGRPASAHPRRSAQYGDEPWDGSAVRLHTRPRTAAPAPTSTHPRTHTHSRPHTHASAQVQVPTAEAAPSLVQRFDSEQERARALRQALLARGAAHPHAEVAASLQQARAEAIRRRLHAKGL